MHLTVFLVSPILLHQQLLLYMYGTISLKTQHIHIKCSSKNFGLVHKTKLG